MPSHQALQGVGLVARVVVDVHVRVLLPPLHDVVDELLEGDLFGGAVMGPPGAIAIRPGHAEEVLEAALHHIWIAFHVEEEVTP